MTPTMSALVLRRLIACSLLLCASIVECRSHHAGFVSNPGQISLGRSQMSEPQMRDLRKATLCDIECEAETQTIRSRRSFLASAVSFGVGSLCMPFASLAEENVMPDVQIQVLPTGDVKKLFNEGRALEAQGNILAAQRLYTKITKVSPGFIYGWSSLGNTLTAQGELIPADQAYTKAISLCEENLRVAEQSPGTRRCDDLYLLLLNRGSVRLNNNQAKEALADLQRSNALRARPDAVILQNLARAQGEDCLEIFMHFFKPTKKNLFHQFQLLIHP